MNGMNITDRSRRSGRTGHPQLSRPGNLILVPASELVNAKTWQDMADRLPCGEILVVLPQDNTLLQDVATEIQRSQHHRGRRAVVTRIRQ